MADMDVCIDCVRDAYDNRTVLIDGTRYVTSVEDIDAEPFFSWYRCELCRSDLGGNRYGINLVEG